MKATQAVVQQRVEQVLKIRLAGAEFMDIRQYASEDDPETGRPWQVSERQLWRYVQASDKLLAKTTERDRDKVLNRHLAQRRRLYALAVESGDWRAGLAILDSEATLLALFPARKVDVNTNGSPMQLTVIEELVINAGKVLDHANGTNGIPTLAGPAAPGPAAIYPQ